MYHIFICKLENNDVNKPTEIDDMQLESKWINIEDLNKIYLEPDCLNDNIEKMINSDVPIFLGSKHIPYNHG
ncbi:hypothetical protein [uncultured Clostridium sp.]|uniref:hypothetical protein n=1 Tax=uncultured Clostridium sp. TaxID=59620 RepID=UPI003217744A